MQVEARKEYLSTVQQKNDVLIERTKELEGLLEDEKQKRGELKEDLAQLQKAKEVEEAQTRSGRSIPYTHPSKLTPVASTWLLACFLLAATRLLIFYAFPPVFSLTSFLPPSYPLPLSPSPPSPPSSATQNRGGHWKQRAATPSGWPFERPSAGARQRTTK